MCVYACMYVVTYIYTYIYIKVVLYVKYFPCIFGIFTEIILGKRKNSSELHDAVLKQSTF